MGAAQIIVAEKKFVGVGVGGSSSFSLQLRHTEVLIAIFFCDGLKTCVKFKISIEISNFILHLLAFTAISLF